ncbi:glycine zipper domain-containing protein [Shewanella sp. UCD-KL12]|uniref:glycine zipper domain-containing protein n=1 Tax=Shewanella sp. UCD-KL12 TaxID=1917163 RepID=UPI000970CC0C|nr:glycine zipper domain-containing protein [Shewanella sp. UCD-KL12]
MKSSLSQVLRTSSLTLSALAISGLALCFSTAVNAEQYIFPEDGQSKEQQSIDKQSCHAWAVEETGFDPENPQVAESISYAAPTSTTQSVEQGSDSGSGMRGAMAGAAAGAVIAEIGDEDRSDAAATGAAVGAIAGRRQSRRSNAQAAEQQAQAEQNAAQQQAQAQAAENQSVQLANTQGTENYLKASSACLEAKGYSVK